MAFLFFSGGGIVLRNDEGMSVAINPVSYSITSRTLHTNFSTKLIVSEEKNDGSCSGGATLSTTRFNQPSWCCSVREVQKGWGSGCFLFGAGETETCLKTQVSKFMEIKSLTATSLIANVEVGFHGTASITPHKVTTDYSPTDIVVSDEIKVSIRCMEVGDKLDASFFLVDSDGDEYLVSKETIHKIDLPIIHKGVTTGTCMQTLLLTSYFTQIYIISLLISFTCIMAFCHKRCINL